MKMIFIICAYLFSFNLFAKPVIIEELYVFDQDKRFLEHFASHADLIVDHVGEKGYEVYGPAGLRVWIQELGLSSINIKQTPVRDNYPSYNQVVKKLNELAAKKPEIIQLFSIGKTSQGRDLWFVKISDNVQVDEVEPEVKYISSMHGDEITGRELMLRLIEDLINGYGSDAEITKLINNTEIFIMPSMNPDGSELRQRANAKNADLNRDFPDFTTADNQNTWLNRELEVQAIMKFQAGRNFALSANFHGGAEVVNYPWDTQKELHPLDKLIKNLSIEYASTVSGMYNSSEFHQGIVNGYAWYEVDGGMQDWSYYWYGDLQVTVELSNSKWPNYAQIPTYYKNNKAALIRYLARVHQGAGFYFDFTKNGIVSITRLGDKEVKVGTFRFNRQEFFKVLEPGEYRFEVEFDGSKKSFTIKVDNTVADNKNHWVKL